MRLALVVVLALTGCTATSPEVHARTPVVIRTWTPPTPFITTTPEH